MYPGNAYNSTSSGIASLVPTSTATSTPTATTSSPQFTVAPGVSDPYLQWINQRQGKVTGFDSGIPFGADASFGQPYSPATTMDQWGNIIPSAPISYDNYGNPVPAPVPAPNMADASAVIASSPWLSAMQAAGVKNLLIPNPAYGQGLSASEGQSAVAPGPFILNPATTAGWRTVRAPAPDGQTVQALMGPNGQISYATHYATSNSSMHLGDYLTAASVLAGGYGLGQLANAAAGGALAGAGTAAAAPTADSVAASGIGTGMADAGTVSGAAAGGAGAGLGAGAGAVANGIADQVVPIVSSALPTVGMTAGEQAALLAGAGGAAAATMGSSGATSPATGTQTAPDQTVNVSGHVPTGQLPSSIPGATAGGAAALAGIGSASTPTINNLPAGPSSGGIGDLLSQLGTFAAKNPQLSASLIGALINKFSGNNGNTSGTLGTNGTANQSNLIASSSPFLGNNANSQRHYNAPPAGYRPGFDPVWNYFSGGIGTLSPTANNTTIPTSGNTMGIPTMPTQQNSR